MRFFLVGALVLAPIESLDLSIQRSVQSIRNPTGDRVMRAVSDIGRPAVVFGGLLAVAVFGGPIGVTTARTAVLALIPTNLAVEALKRGVNRTRPDGEHKRSNASFPSSHSANAFALAAALAVRFQRFAPALWLFAASVAASRVYLNRHYLSDVVVGALIGVAAVWLVTRLSRDSDRASKPRA